MQMRRGLELTGHRSSKVGDTAWHATVLRTHHGGTHVTRSCALAASWQQGVVVGVMNPNELTCNRGSRSAGSPILSRAAVWRQMAQPAGSMLGSELSSTGAQVRRTKACACASCAAEWRAGGSGAAGVAGVVALLPTCVCLAAGVARRGGSLLLFDSAVAADGSELVCSSWP